MLKDVNLNIPASIIKAMQTKEGLRAIKKEYTRLRAIAQKRLKRMEQASKKKCAKTDWTKTEAYKAYDGTVPKLRGMSEAHLPYELAKLSRWVGSETSSIKKMKERQTKTLQTLRKHGYNIAEEDFLDFTDYMEEWRERHLDEIYDSEQAAEVYWRSAKKNRDPKKVLDDFYEWQENYGTKKAYEKLEKLPKNKRKSKKISQQSNGNKELKKRWRAIKKALR